MDGFHVQVNPLPRARTPRARRVEVRDSFMQAPAFLRRQLESSTCVLAAVQRSNRTQGKLVERNERERVWLTNDARCALQCFLILRCELANASRGYGVLPRAPHSYRVYQL